MKLILRFLKPHWKLCFFTILFVIVNVVGALIIPTFTADMLNQGTTAGADFSTLVNTYTKMLIAALISGVATIFGAYVCSDLTSKVGADIRSALYKKTLSLSGSDFRSFGTASVTTRTVLDITNIQFALLSCFQILFPCRLFLSFPLCLPFTRIC